MVLGGSPDLDAIVSKTLQEMTAVSTHLAKTRALTLFEMRADFYYRRTGYLAPGKDCRMHDTSSEENRERFRHWRDSGLMQIDALLEVARLRALLEVMESRAEDAAADCQDWKRRYGLLQTVLDGSGA